jgi:hypothetical protein
MNFNDKIRSQTTDFVFSDTNNTMSSVYVVALKAGLGQRDCGCWHSQPVAVVDLQTRLGFNQHKFNGLVSLVSAIDMKY